MSKTLVEDFTPSTFVRALARTVLVALVLGISACVGTGHGSGTADTGFTAANPPPPATRSSAADPAPAISGSTAPARDYLIGPQDLLKIEVFGVDSMSRSVRVNDAGQIVLPIIGVVQAGGMTSEHLATEIAARLGRDYLQHPQVLIFIEEYTSQRVTVVGAVSRSGVYPLKGRTTLLQAVASAGGPTSVANVKSVKIIRPGPDGTRSIQDYNLADIRDGRIADPEIRGEDVVLVDTSAVKDTIKQTVEFIFPFMVFGALL